MTEPDPLHPPLIVRRVIPIPREQVFDAWLDPKRLARFMRPRDVVHTAAEVDARVGGRFRIVMHHKGVPVEHTGEYLLIDRPARLSFTWRSVHTDGQPTTVTIDFLERGGGTEVVLTHTQLPAREVDSHRKGWSDILHALSGEP